MPIRMRTVAIAANACLALAPGVLAPCFAARTDPCAASSTVSDVQFSLALPSGQTVYRQGEIIPISLAFTSTAKDRYTVADRTYDRSGRLEIEHYCLEPEAPDPLVSYFSVGAFIGGGLFSTHTLDSKPFTAQADLNEYLSPAPGHYRLYAVSGRISRPPDPHEETPYGRVSEVVRSNTVEFDIKPAPPQWQHQQLQGALATLSAAPRPNPTASSQNDPGRQAARRIRFLNSRESAQQLAHLFAGRDSGQDEPYAWDFALGLFGSPYRQLAIDSMRRQFAVPDHPITADFLETLVRLEITADPAWDTPESFTSGNTPDGKVIDAFWKSRQAHEQELTQAESEDLLANLSRKTGRARALTALGLLNAGRQSPLPPALAEDLRLAVIASWKELPAGTQDQLIQDQWPLVARPEMLPVLRAMAAQPPPAAHTTAAVTRDAVLRRIYDLDPAVARPLILSDLRNPHAEPSLALLKLLPPEEIAPAIQPAMQRIAQSEARDLDFAILDRYADATILGQAQAAFEPNLGKWACAPQASLLRYFLRVAPEYGAAQVAASLQARRDTHCYSMLLQQLGNQLPQAEQSAIEALDDPDPQVVQDAVVALGQWGSSAAEAALWTRLERFHQEWAGRQDELRSTPDYRSPGSRAVALEQALLSALAGGTGWLCTPEKLLKLQSLVLTSDNRQQVGNLLEQWKQQPYLINPNWNLDGETTFNLLNSSSITEDQLRAKLAEFPKGTRLAWQFWQPGQIQPPVSMEKQEAAYAAIQSTALEHGLTLEKANHP
jgi:hypothetical protein